MPRVICLGELLIDLCASEPDVSLAEARTFTKAPGGAPANVAVGLQRLGVDAGFIGAVGDDPFGEFLTGVLEADGVDVSHLARIAEARTSLAWIASRSDAGKDITFYRNPGADMFLSPEHIEEAYVQAADALHYGSISLIDPSPAEATFQAHLAARQAGAMISYDPNWRPTLWPDRDHARETILAGFGAAHVAKVSDEEWEFITGEECFHKGAAALLERGPELIVRSEGPDGASFMTAKCFGHAGAFEVDCVEPTGAGDAFMACLIAELLQHWTEGERPGQIDQTELMRIVTRANATGALACTAVGAIPSLPTRAAVDELLAAAR
jgi:fructokinase